jgi:hypothetical protein
MSNIVVARNSTQVSHLEISTLPVILDQIIFVQDSSSRMYLQKEQKPIKTQLDFLKNNQEHYF